MTPPAPRTVCAHASSVAPVVTTSSRSTTCVPFNGGPRQMNRGRNAKRASRARPRCVSPRTCRSPAVTRDSNASRAMSSQPSKPRCRRREAVVGTGTAIASGGMRALSLSAKASATSRRPFFIARIAWRSAPSYMPNADTLNVGSLRTMSWPCGKHASQSPDPIRSHAPHCGGKTKSKSVRRVTGYVHAVVRFSQPLAALTLRLAHHRCAARGPSLRLAFRNAKRRSGQAGSG